VQFEITANFAPLEAGRLQQVLRELGSEGMARRLDLMQREGLLP
jgi:type IV pilus assembly protein PilN